jgi:sugar/nucleoside kinase (ribokinase family)
VDTTGCGDAFAAAFLTARAGGAPLAEALGAGTRRAAGVAAHLGAFPTHTA